MISLSILKRIETLMREAGQGERLCDSFDYIAGSETGAFVATALARGMSVDEITRFLVESAAAIFSKPALLQRLSVLYTADPLKQRLKEVFGDATMEPEHLRCLLLVVLQNATTNSPWPLSSNPDAKYNDSSRRDSNLRIPLWQLVRASMATPVYFPPETIRLDPDDPSLTFTFVGGGATPYYNPAFLLYRMATVPAYRLAWRQGEGELTLVSVGSGRAPATSQPADPDPAVAKAVTNVITALMSGAMFDQDINCRVVGRCVHGGALDREVGDLSNGGEEPRAFRYARYDVDLSAGGLSEFRLSGMPASVVRTDNTSAENLAALQQIGEAAAQQANIEHLLGGGGAAA